MKKHLWLLAFCSTAYAEQVVLAQMEYQNFQLAEKTVFTQHYDPKKQILEVTDRAEGKQPFRHKRLVQFDDKGKKILHFEEFRWDNATQQWEKDAKGEQKNADGKEIYFSYQGKNNEWVPYGKTEKQSDGKSEAWVTYKFSADGKMLPETKSYTLFHENKKEAAREEYEWDNLKQQWRTVSKMQHSYNADNEKNETQYFLGRNNEWVLNQKIIYHTEADGTQVSEHSKRENEKWLPVERSEQRWSQDRRQKVTLVSRWNAQQNSWENYQRAETGYLPNDQIESDNFALWDEKLQQWYIITESRYTFDKKGRVNQIESVSPSKMGKEGKRITYQYDEAGNVTEERIQQRFETKENIWRDMEKIRYRYDLSLRKEDVVDKDNIADEELTPMVNALVKKEIYRIEKNGFKLVEQLQFSYAPLNSPLQQDRQIEKSKPK